MNKRLSKINKNAQFPWYDSYWLYSYVQAKSFISENYPHKLADFIEKFEILKTKKTFETLEIENLFSENEISSMKNRIQEIQKEEYEKYEFLDFGRIIKHDDPLFNQLQDKICAFVSQKVGEEVECSYNFLSLYNNLGILNPHMDATPAKWTLDFCLEQSSIWPIHLSKVLDWPENFEYTENWIEKIKSNTDNEFKTYNLEAGKAIIFSGLSQWHYRDRIQNLNKTNFCHLIFFHFIPKGTKDLCYPKKWSKLFEIPELDNIVIDL